MKCPQCGTDSFSKDGDILELPACCFNYLISLLPPIRRVAVLWVLVHGHAVGSARLRERGGAL